MLDNKAIPFITSQKQETKQSESYSPRYDYLFKFRLIGDSGVGKSCLLLRYCDNTYTDSYISTIGVAFKIKTLTLEQKTIKTQVWDTAGEERFLAIEWAHARGSHAVIVVFDLTDQLSFKNVTRWLDEYSHKVGIEGNIILVGTKSDRSSIRVIDSEQVKTFISGSQYKIDAYIETSAKTGENVNLVFETASKVVLSRLAPEKKKTIESDLRKLPSVSVPEKQAPRMNQELFDAIKAGDTEFIKRYCYDGRNREKFIEVMTLGIDENNKKPADRGKTALFVAAKNNHIQLVNFIIETAKWDIESQKLLAKHLTEKNQEGKNVLHETACTPNSEQIIQSLCDTARVLYAQNAVAHKALSNYVNLPDDNYGSTALHFSARQANFSNYLALTRAKADTTAKASNKMSAFDVLRYGDPNRTPLFMKSWIQQTDEGKYYIKKRYGCLLEEVSESVLDSIIKIELDMMLNDNSRAQLNAFRESMRLIASANKGKDLAISLSTIDYINFSIITEADLDDDTSGPVLKEIIKKAAVINDPEIKNLYIRAAILSEHKEHSEANKAAFDNYGYGVILKQYPKLALEGIRNLNITELDKTLVAKRLTIAIANIALQQLQENPPKKTGFSGLFASVDAVPTQTINKFLADLHNVTTINELSLRIAALPNDGLVGSLRDTLETMLKGAQFSVRPPK